MSSSTGARLLILALVTLLIATLFHEFPERSYWMRGLAQYLLFLPIVMAGLWFGWRGGLATAIACALLTLPRLITQGSAAGYKVQDLAEGVDLVLVGTVFGVLADRERRKTLELERTGAELRATYAELRHSLEHLKRAERLSGVGQLTANLAHEIRNPLASIEGAAGLLENPDGLTPEQRTEFVRIIKTESRRLNRLLTDMLNYSRPASPRFIAADLRPLVESVVNLVSSTARRAGVEIAWSAAPDLPAVDCDPAQIQQVAMNMILNAIQAMPEGGRIEVAAVAHGAEVAIQVRDQGPGISPEDADRIFSPFYTTKPTGTGLGLAISQQIAVAHGGEITVSANQPRGAVFSLVFPAARRRNGAAAPETAA